MGNLLSFLNPRTGVGYMSHSILNEIIALSESASIAFDPEFRESLLNYNTVTQEYGICQGISIAFCALTKVNKWLLHSNFFGMIDQLQSVGTQYQQQYLSNLNRQSLVQKSASLAIQKTIIDSRLRSHCADFSSINNFINYINTATQSFGCILTFSSPYFLHVQTVVFEDHTYYFLDPDFGRLTFERSGLLLYLKKNVSVMERCNNAFSPIDDYATLNFKASIFI